MIVKSLTGIDIGINYVHQILMYKMTIAHAGKDVVITYLFIINSLWPSLSFASCVYGFTDSRLEMAEWLELLCNLQLLVILHSPDQADFHRACYDWVVGKQGSIPRAVRDIELTACTTFTLGVHLIPWLEDPCGKEKLFRTPYSLGGRMETQSTHCAES